MPSPMTSLHSVHHVKKGMCMNFRTDDVRRSLFSKAGNIAWNTTNFLANLTASNKRPHPAWAPGPLPKASERSRPELGFPRSTKSLCPECNREAASSVLHGDQPLSFFRDNPGVIDAHLVEEAGRILIRKACPHHGPYEDVISNDPAFTKRMESMYFGNDFDRSGPFTYGEGPLSVQKGRGSFLIVDLTNRCNMKCSPCFMDANNLHYVHEMDFDDVKKVFDNAQSIKPQRELSILFSGGEPTIAPVFLDAVRYARESGFTRLHVATNGIRFAEDPSLAQQAKAAGLCGVYLQIDGVTNADNLHRGIANLFDVKCRALENIHKAGMRATLQVTVVNGLNNASIGKIVEFAIANIDKVQGVVFQPLMFAGRDAMVSNQERYEKRYTLSDLAHDLAEQVPGDVQVMRDWFPMSVYTAFAHLLDQMNPDANRGSLYGDIHPNHGQFCPIIVNTSSKQFLPLASFFDLEGFVGDLRKIGDRFTGKLLTNLQIGASIIRHFKSELAPSGFSHKDLLSLFRQAEIRSKQSNLDIQERDWRLFLMAGMWFQDLFNIDLTAIQMSSTVVASGEGEISFCIFNAGNWRAMHEDLNKTARLSDWHKLHGRHTIYANGKLVHIEGLPSTHFQPNAEPIEAEPLGTEQEVQF